MRLIKVIILAVLVPIGNEFQVAGITASSKKYTNGYVVKKPVR
jgi:hypothetical protein